jgi:hypothetical protein
MSLWDWLTGRHPSPTPPIVVPPPTPEPGPGPSAPARVHNEGEYFVDQNGRRWTWRGATDFLLLKKVLDHEDITPLLAQRASAGANLVRVFCICKNIADLNPSSYSDYWGGIDQLLTQLDQFGLQAELTVFADAQLVMPGESDQVAFWQGFAQFAGRNCFLELVNENSHPGNTINPAAFSPLAGLLCSHGSGQTDEHPVTPFWNYVTYHARRDTPPDARGATNYDPYEFEAGFPKDRPWIADEGIKVTDPAYAELMGRHAAVGSGGTFHSQSGVMSVLWSDAELQSAKRFYSALGA